MTRTSGAGGLGGSGSSPTITPDTLLADDVVEFVLGIQEGPIGGLVDGPKTFYLSDTPLVNQSDENNFNPFELHLYHGDASASDVRLALGGSTSNTNVGVTLAEDTPVIRTTPDGLKNLIDQLEVRIVFNQLMRTPNGDQLVHTAQFNLEYKAEQSGTWLPFYDNALVEITGKTSSGYPKDFVKAVPRIDDNYEIRVTKVSGDNVTDEVVVLTWESFQSVTTTPRSYDNLAVVRGLGRASDQFSGIPSFTGVYAGKLVMVPSNYDTVTRYYDGSWDGTFQLAHTDNPVWCLYDLLTNSEYGFRKHYPQLLVDRFTFYDAAKWCDELVEIGTSGTYQPRWTYNDLISQPRSAIELVQYICGVFGGVLISDLNGTVILKVDRPGVPVQIYAPESVEESGFQYQFSDIAQRINSVTVRFINPQLGWESDARGVSISEYIDANGLIPDNEMIAVGCNNVHEAQRRAYRRILQANTEVVTVSFQTTRQGMALELFDLIGINDPDMAWGLSGRVKSQSGTTIYLRDPLMVPDNTDLTLSLQTPSGVHDLTVQSATPVTVELQITAGSWPGDAPDRAQFGLSAEGSIGVTKPFRVLRIEEDPQNKDLYSVTALEQNINKYGDADDLDTSGTVDYDHKYVLLPAAPVIEEVGSGEGYLFFHQGGSPQNRIYLRWSHDPLSMCRNSVVLYRRKDAESFQEIQVSGTQAYIPNVQTGQEYEIVVRGLNRFGVRGYPSATSTHLVQGDAGAPVVPTTPTLTGGFGTIDVEWPENTETDLSHYELAVNDTAGQARAVDRVVTGNSLAITGLGDGVTRYISTRAVDTSGNASDWTTEQSAVTTLVALASFDTSALDAIADAAESASGDISYIEGVLKATLETALTGSTSDMETIGEDENSQFQQGWAGWFTVSGVTTADLPSKSGIEVGVLNGDDSLTISSLNTDINLAHIVFGGALDIITEAA